MYLKLILLSLLLLPTTHAQQVQNKSICAHSDNRIFSYDSKVGKIIHNPNDEIGCTATLIGPDCAITAGHCLAKLHYMEFNIQHPYPDGTYPPRFPEDIYEIDQSSIIYKNIDIHDWAVFNLRPNQQTGLKAGITQGYYSISQTKPHKKQVVTITGYGLEFANSRERTLQRTHSAKIHKVSMLMHTLTHFVDTMPGNSGSAIILQDSNEIIGIHTNGGCDEREKDNLGTLIYKNFELNQAIKKCLHMQQ